MGLNCIWNEIFRGVNWINKAVYDKMIRDANSKIYGHSADLWSDFFYRSAEIETIKVIFLCFELAYVKREGTK